MVDRIADVFGARTPHRRGTVWPARVDQFLEPGLAEADVEPLEVPVGEGDPS